MLSNHGKGPEIKGGCNDALEHASEMLEAQPSLTPEQLRLLSAHYARCAPCREYLNSLEALVEALRSMPAVDCPESLRSQLRSHPDSKA